MKKNKEIVYNNVCNIFEEYVIKMRKDIERAFENDAINIDVVNPAFNPMFLGHAMDIVAASLRSSLMRMKPYISNKEGVIKLSEEMFHNFVPAEREKEFIENILKEI